MNKTLIGKNGYLFLQNDSAKELEVHCNNLNLITDKKLEHYNKNINKYFMVIYPNKCFVYRAHLPDKYKVKYRPGFDIYKNKFGKKILDGYKLLKDLDDVYYKTDTHINLKGNYIIYKNFIETVNDIYNLELKPKIININKEKCVLSHKNLGIGDLTWETNLGNQILDDNDKMDTFYYSDDIPDFYCRHIITNDELRFLDYDLIDKTNCLLGDIVNWVILSQNIIYNKNNNCKHKVIIFYDSFLISILPLFFNLFNEIFLIKNAYHDTLINLINPDYIFEFRLERFLC